MTQLRFAEQERVFLGLLNGEGVEYLVIGGYAVVYHGYQRPIGDLDVWIATTPENGRRMVRVMEAFGGGLPREAEGFFEMTERVIRIGRPPFVVERFRPEERFIHLGEQPPQVEVMTWISGVTFEPCYAERLEVEVDGIIVKMISLPCLQVNKRESIRPKDADDYFHLCND